MIIVLGGVNHKKPFLLLASVLGLPSSAINHETLDLVQVLSRSLKGSKVSFEVSYFPIELPSRGAIPSPSVEIWKLREKFPPLDKLPHLEKPLLGLGRI